MRSALLALALVSVSQQPAGVPAALAADYNACLAFETKSYPALDACRNVLQSPLPQDAQLTARTALAAAEWLTGDRESAIDDMSRAAQLAPASALHVLMAAEFLAEEERHEEAGEYFKTAIRLGVTVDRFKRDLESRFLFGRPQHDSTNVIEGLGRAFAALGRREEASAALEMAYDWHARQGYESNTIRVFGQIIQLQPNRLAEYLKWVDDLVAVTTALSPEQRVRAYSDAIAVNGRSARAYLGRGQALQDIRQMQAALTDFREALRLDPSSTEARAGRDALQDALDPTAQRRRCVERLHTESCDAALEQTSGSGSNDLRLFRYLSGRFEGGFRPGDEAALRQVVQVNPGDALAWYALGGVASGDESARAYRKAIELKPNWVNAYERLAAQLEPASVEAIELRKQTAAKLTVKVVKPYGAGLLLGFSTPTESNREVATAWITSVNGTWQLAAQGRGLLVPRATGFWWVGVDHPTGDWFDVIAWAGPVGLPLVLTQRSSEDASLRDSEGERTVRVTFAGPNHVAAAETFCQECSRDENRSFKLYGFHQLGPRPVPDRVEGLSIAEVFGAGAERTLKSALDAANRESVELSGGVEYIPNDVRGWSIVRGRGEWKVIGHAGTGANETVSDVPVPVPAAIAGPIPLLPPWPAIFDEVPDAVDAIPSLRGDLIVVVTPARLWIYEVAARRLGARVGIISLSGVEVVMAQWATGRSVDRWTNEVVPLLRAGIPRVIDKRSKQ